MEPISETSHAIEEYGPFLSEGDLLAQLRAMAADVQALVPRCIGLSLSSREHGVTFTMVASEETIAQLDALQYLDGGPCVAAMDAEEVQQFAVADMLDEDRWQLFARGTAATGVASTLTLPIMSEGSVIGSVNLYASSRDAFNDKHEELAELLGAWAPGAMANTDLGFETRRTAERAPQILLDEMRVEVAVGILVAAEGMSVPDARARLRDAAVRAGISESAVAKIVIQQQMSSEPPDEQ